MFAEDERAYPQAVFTRRTSTEGDNQNPATGGWRESRWPYKWATPGQQGPRFTPVRPGQTSVPDGSARPVLNGKWSLGDRNFDPLTWAVQSTVHLLDGDRPAAYLALFATDRKVVMF
jgi:hypothetical protein